MLPKMQGLLCLNAPLRRSVQAERSGELLSLWLWGMGDVLRALVRGLFSPRLSEQGEEALRGEDANPLIALEVEQIFVTGHDVVRAGG
jgi:hypothetical protein